MIDHQIQAADNRTICFADYGPASGLAVLWCHGGPGSRLGPRRISKQAAAAGFRLIGIDRPGYGKSTPLPGRSICDWTQDALAVADHLTLWRCQGGWCRRRSPRRQPWMLTCHDYGALFWLTTQLPMPSFWRRGVRRGVTGIAARTGNTTPYGSAYTAWSCSCAAGHASA